MHCSLPLQYVIKKEKKHFFIRLFWNCECDDWAGIVSNWTMGLFGRSCRYSYELFRGCAGKWIENSPQNSPTMQFDATSTQSYSATLNWPTQLYFIKKTKSDHRKSVAVNKLTACNFLSYCRPCSPSV